MYNAKLNISILFLLLVFSFMFSLPTQSACKSKQLTKVCNACKTQALNSSECMATTTTTGTDFFFGLPLLKTSYVISSMLYGNTTENYNLTIIEKQFDASTFTYSITNLPNNSVLIGGYGSSFYDVINFNLPIPEPVDEAFFITNWNCFGFISDTSPIIEGACTTSDYDPNSIGNIQKFGGEITLVPN